MYLIVPTQPTCAHAWAAAAMAVIKAGDEAYNVVIDVDEPTKFSDQDNEAITPVNDFQRASSCWSPYEPPAPLSQGKAAVPKDLQADLHNA
jgi:hypothetical protein